MMRATIRLHLVNQETVSIFSRTLKNGDNFFERVNVKAGMLIKESVLNNAHALVAIYTLHDELTHLSAFFDDEIDKFEGQIEKRNMPGGKSIQFKVLLEQEFPCSNTFSMALAELIELFDKLISTLKLVHLAGLLDSRHTLYTLKQNYQKKLNVLLSKVIQTVSFKNKSLTIQEAIRLCDSKHPELNFSLLKAALQSPYAPGFSPHVLSQLGYQINQTLKQKEVDASLSTIEQLV